MLKDASGTGGRLSKSIIMLHSSEYFTGTSCSGTGAAEAWIAVKPTRKMVTDFMAACDMKVINYADYL